MAPGSLKQGATGQQESESRFKYVVTLEKLSSRQPDLWRVRSTGEVVVNLGKTKIAQECKRRVQPTACLTVLLKGKR